MIKFAEKLNSDGKNKCVNFLKDHQPLVDYLKENNLNALYTYLSHEILTPSNILLWGPSNIGLLTQLLIESGIDIFNYLDYIPAFCFYNTSIIEFEVPINAKHIKYKAFCKSALEKIIFPENCELLDIQEEAFKGSELTGIIELPKSMSYVESSAFNNTDISGLILPKGCAFDDPRGAQYYYQWRK